MALLDEIRASGRTSGTMCNLRKAAETLDAEDRADLDVALADSSFAGSQIARALSARGVKVSPGTVQRHRKGECGCGRAG